MHLKLKECIDCGKPLSRTAKVCNGCNSTDPFGSKRLNDKIHRYIVTFVILILLIIGGLWYLGELNPLDILLRR